MILQFNPETKLLEAYIKVKLDSHKSIECKTLINTGSSVTMLNSRVASNYSINHSTSKYINIFGSRFPLYNCKLTIVSESIDAEVALVDNFTNDYDMIIGMDVISKSHLEISFCDGISSASISFD